MTDYPRSVAVTWQPRSPSWATAADGGFEACAALAPEKCRSRSRCAGPGAEAENLRDTRDDLTAYSLVTRDADRPFFLVYRLVQDVTRRSLSGEAQLRSLVERYSGLAMPVKVTRATSVRGCDFEPLAPHMREVVTYADEHSIGQPTTNVMNQLAGYSIPSPPRSNGAVFASLDERASGEHPTLRPASTT